MNNPKAKWLRIGGAAGLFMLLLSCREPVYRPPEESLEISIVPWRQASVPGESRPSQWRSLASSADGMKLAAVDAGGFIHISADGGQTWNEKTAAGSREWTSIEASADGMRFAAAVSPGLIYTSSDGGEVWIPQSGSGRRHWIELASSTDGLRLVAAAPYEFLYTSSNGGASWTCRTTAGSRNWTAVASSGDGLRLAGCAGGSTFISRDGGDTWEERATCSGHELRAIASSADGLLLAAGTFDGHLYLSDDGGDTWNECFGAGTYNTWAVACSSNGDEIEVVNGASVYVSMNRGETWMQRALGTDQITAIARSSDGTKLVAASRYICTSADSGVNWTEHRNVGRRKLCAIAGSSDLNSLSVVDSGGFMYSSLDGGASWAEQAAAGTKAWVALAASSDGQKLVASHCELDPAVSTSPDGGKTWLYRTVYNHVAWLASSADGRQLAMIDVSGMVRISENSGGSWIDRGELRPGAGCHEPAIALPANGNLLAAAFFSDASRVVVSCFGHIFTSANAGATWKQHDEVGYESWQSVAMSSDGNTVAAAPEGGLIVTSNDGGYSWTAHEGAGFRKWSSIVCSSDGTRFAAVAEVERNGVYLFP